ncbi:MAG TPA: hypothetical protein VI959_01130 [Alphaproteobacteria bacterium]|nr:hypothetical protein [Alphaproteobacteria bacterium]
MKHAHLFLVLLLSILNSCRLDKSEPVLGPKPTQEDLKELTQPPAKKIKKPKVKQKLDVVPDPIPDTLLKPVSLTLSGDIPLKEALLALSKQAKIDIQLDNSLEVFPLYSVTQKPLIEVIWDLCEMGNLKFTRKGGGCKNSTR